MFDWFFGISIFGWIGAVVGALAGGGIGYVVYNNFIMERKDAAATRISEGGWKPTGRIDFALTGAMPETAALHQTSMLLRAEDTREIKSVTDVPLKESRWRLATLDEAKKVVKTFHGANGEPAGQAPR